MLLVLDKMLWRNNNIAVEKNIRLNEEITAPKIRVIDQAGEQVGIIMLSDALSMAEKVELDLVEIVPTEDPPVCRIMDYGKFVFAQSKKKNSAKKKQKQIQTKEIKIRPGTDHGDYQIKLRNIKRFLQQGDKVKVTLRFRGREIAHQGLGVQMLDRIKGDVAELAEVEQLPKMEGRQMVMVIMPKR
ncbi:Translation initiation factor 3 [uncultured Candidatus Thioglobus sp.]|nr:Translation initiation factor 3 [uncultured Candidatus Thioglobus sp.]